MVITLSKDEKDQTIIFTADLSEHIGAVTYFDLSYEHAIQLGKLLIDMATTEDVLEMSLSINRKESEEKNSGNQLG